MNTSKSAIPVCYRSERDTPRELGGAILTAEQKIGMVDVVAADGPPLTVRPWTPTDGDNKHISIDFENILKLTERELGINLDANALMRLCMHLRDARQLTCHLIMRLAESGDRVAIALQEYMNQAMDDVKMQDQPPQKAHLFVKHIVLQDNSLDSMNLSDPRVVYKITWPTDQAEAHRERISVQKKIVSTYNPTIEEQEEGLKTVKRILQKFNLLINQIEQFDPFNRQVDYKQALSDSLTPEVNLSRAMGFPPNFS